MPNRTYEADKDGKIYVYPSLVCRDKKARGILKTLVELMVDIVKGRFSKSLGDLIK